MNINRNNYEEFYLLYVDGELSAQDRLAVEQFMEDNPDTAHELIMLNQTKLDADPVIFSDKSSLYKIASDELNLSNYEERFLLYADDELNVQQKKETELFVLQHPQLQEEFTVLMQTRLTDETIAFPDKASLYRKEENPVIYFNWKRIGIAAALIGFLFLVWTIIPVKDKTTQQIASAKTEVSKTIHNSNGLNNAGVVSKTDLVKKQIRGLRQIASAIQTESNVIIAKNDVEIKMPITASKNENILEQADPVITSTGNIATMASVDKQLPNNNASIADTQEKSIYQQTIYKELDTEQDERRNNIYIGNVEVNKDKLLGFFKRASHVFSRSKDDDGKVAIANFSIETKSLK